MPAPTDPVKRAAWIEKLRAHTKENNPALSPEARLKIRNSNLARWSSKEYRDKIIPSMTDANRCRDKSFFSSDQFKEKMSAASKRMWQTKDMTERNKKVSESKKGSKHPLWKGDAVGYEALHEWVRNNYGVPDACECCGASNCLIEAANLTGKYLRVREDWQFLCRSCHNKLDGKLVGRRTIVEKTIYQEVFAVATEGGLTPVAGETAAQHVARIIDVLAKVPETLWNKLSDAAQAWFNTAAEALNGGQTPSAPAGIEEFKSEPAPAPETPKTDAPAADGAGQAEPKKRGRQAGRGGIIEEMRREVINNPEITYDAIKAALVAKGRKEEEINENTLYMVLTDMKVIIRLMKSMGKFVDGTVSADTPTPAAEEAEA